MEAYSPQLTKFHSSIGPSICPSIHSVNLIGSDAVWTMKFFLMTLNVFAYITRESIAFLNDHFLCCLVHQKWQWLSVTLIS